MRTRYIPKDAQEVEHPKGLGVVYTYTDPRGKACGIAYTAKQSKVAWHHLFVTAAARDAEIQKFFASLESWERIKEERKVERAAPHSLKVGDIIYNSWGYDQTNVDFYVIVKTSNNYVWLHPIAQDTTETGFMCGHTRPAHPLRLCPKKMEDGTNAPPSQHRASKDSVGFEFGCGSKWTETREGVACSWYA